MSAWIIPDNHCLFHIFPSSRKPDKWWILIFQDDSEWGSTWRERGTFLDLKSFHERPPKAQKYLAYVKDDL